MLWYENKIYILGKENIKNNVLGYPYASLANCVILFVRED